MIYKKSLTGGFLEEGNQETCSKLELNEDFYCLAYCMYIKENNASLETRSDMFMRCVFIFTIQALMVVFVLYEMTDGDPLKLFKNLKPPETTGQLAIRFICSILLHW
jgi:hypothetical protein